MTRPETESVSDDQDPATQTNLADIFPSAASLIDGTGHVDRLGLAAVAEASNRVIVVLIDGLGAAAIARYREFLPFLTALGADGRAMTIRTCLPSTTATSLASLATGRQPGKHGVVGYSMYMRSIDTVMNMLKYTEVGNTRRGPLDTVISPETVQPCPSVFERIRAGGVKTTCVGPAAFEASPMTRANYRDTTYLGWDDPAQIPAACASALDAPRSLAYAYYPRLDTLGHIHGFASVEYRDELTVVDDLCRQIYEALPKSSTMFVTGDHGIVDIEPSGRLDFDDDGELRSSTAAIAGEPRFRHLHARRGAVDELYELCEDRFGSIATVITKRQAIADGWFGATVTQRVVPLIGDVIVAFDEPYGLFQPKVDPLQARLVGHHGSFTADEAEVPLLGAHKT